MTSEAIKYPNRLRECIKANGYKIQDVAEETHIPLRTLTDYCAGKAAIPRERLEKLAALLGYPVEHLVPTLSHAIVTPLLWSVPHQRNPYFTGREALLQQLHHTLNTSKAAALTHPQAISGLGGIGKTQLALEYAYRYHEEYEAVFWLKADTRESLLADFQALARLLNLPEKHAEEQMKSVLAVIAWLKAHPRWLLIFDNADDLAMIRPFLPPALDGHLLLTTRAQSMGGLAQHIEVACMTPEVGALFLLRRASLLAPDATLEAASAQDRALALQIVEELGGLPLALDQAGAYMEESAYHLKGYLKLYQRQRTALLKRRGGLATDHPEPVATTWALSFEQVEQADALAAELLRFCAFLDPDAIPEEILLEAARLSHAQENTTSPDELRINAAIEVLLRFSLVQRNAETETLTIHRLVQAVIQDAMDKGTQRYWAERAAQAVHKAFPQASNVYSASGYPHRAVQLLHVSLHVDQQQDNKGNLAIAIWNLAVQQQVLGRLTESEQNLQQCIALCQEAHDPFNRAKAHQYFALLRAYQGMFTESFQHLDTASSLFREANAPASEGIVCAYRSLCMLLAKDFASAFTAATHARKLANEQTNERDIIRSEWLLGWTKVYLASKKNEQASELLNEAQAHLHDALDRCRRTGTVDYEADLLLAWARLHHAKGDSNQAKIHVIAALAITNRSDFRVLRADIHNLLAELAIEESDWRTAKNYVQAAYGDAFCDGPPYCYKPAFEKAKHLLDKINRSYSAEVSHL